MVACEGSKIQQVLLNILNNGAYAMFEHKRTQAGHKPKFIFRLLHKKEMNMLQIEIEDNGSGIEKEKLDKIFEPFYTTHEKGTGLGLAIVHKIVENHNGEIRVTSPPRGMTSGCCFSIIIPITIGKDAGDLFEKPNSNKTLHKRI